MADREDWRSNPASAPYAEKIGELERTYSLPANLLGSLINRESRFDPNAVSQAGARGLAQLMPIHEDQVDPLDGPAALEYSAKYLSALHRRFGQWDKALAAYNYGPTNLSQVLREHGPEWMKQMPEETRNYVAALKPADRTAILDPEDDVSTEMKVDVQAQLEALKTRHAEEQKRIADMRTAVANLPPPPPVESDSYLSVLGEHAYEFGRAPKRGAIKAVQEAANLVGELADSLPDSFDVIDGGIEWGEHGPRIIGRDEWRARKLAGTVGLDQLKLVDEKDAIKTGFGQVTEGAAQFATGFIIAGKALKAAGWANSVTKVGQIGRAMTQGAIADFAAFDEHEKRLSNFIQDYPALQNPITEYLAADENDGEFEGRLKNAIEGAGLGAVTDIIIKGLKVMKLGRVFKRAEADEALGKQQAAELKVEDHQPPEPKPEAQILEPEVKLEEQPKAEPGKVEKIIAQVDDPARALDPDALRSRIKVSTEKVAEAAEQQLTTPTRTIDELSDFNVEKFDVDMDTIEDVAHVRNILETTSEVFAKEIDAAKGGVQTNKVTSRLAELVGTSAERVHKLYAETRGKHGLAARVLAAEQTLLASARNVKKLADAAYKSGQAPEAMIRFHHAVRTHALIQAEVKGAQTEVARALNAMKILRSATAEQFRVMDDVQRLVGGQWANDKLLQSLIATGNVSRINKIVRKTAGRRVADVALEVYINSLLSGPKTLAVNIISNSFKTAEAIIERPMIAAFGAVRRTVFRSKAERAQAREALALMHGALEGFIESVRLPIAEMAKTAPTKWSKLDYGTMWKSAIEERPIIDARGQLEGSRKAIHFENADTALKKGVNVAGALVRLPSRGIMATDELFKTMAYRQQLRALAMRQALESADVAKLVGKKRRAHVASEVEKTLRDPPEELMLEAQNFMRYQTFQSELGKFGKWLQRGSSQHPFVTVILPFVRTPLNIFKQGLERSPFAPLLGEFRQAMKQGGVAADQALARMTMGTGVALTFWWLAAQGKIKGGGKLGDRKNSERLDGSEPYVMQIGDTWYQYNRLDPWGMVMGLTADSYDFYANNMAPHEWVDEREHPASKVLAAAALIASKNMLSKTWAKGVMDVSNVLSDPDRYADGWVKNIAANFVPYSSLMRGITKETDESGREAFTFVETMKRNIPGLSDELPEKRDWLGDVVPNKGDVINPVVSYEGTDDPLRKELAALRFNLDMPDKNMDGIPLSAKQYSRFLELRGKVVKDGNGQSLQDALREYIKGDEWKKLSDGVGEISSGKAEAVKKFVSAWNRGAKAQLLEEDSELRQQWETLKQATADSKFEQDAE